ncbi:2'-5' RNA ligase family protein [Nodosilinea nodulosa]|uniref:2'-5' RNA ligase family protein n=1 Tax=Nodosilinea nodulosa TaxID=416001 RepID=UPI0002EDCAD3|nr:2'-5' RNA ligase family protein [Nodosilinea nodulosa]
MTDARTAAPGRFFVALLPPPPLQDEITAIKQDIWQRFDSGAALKSPPHITLQPPFQWPPAQVDSLEQCLAAFARSQPPVPIQLRGFSAFAPRVIYVDVARTAEVMAIQAALAATLGNDCGIADRVADGRPFIPHITVGFRDLTVAAFQQAWDEFCDRPFAANFVAQNLTLLRHDSQRWQVCCQFSLRSQPPQETN